MVLETTPAIQVVLQAKQVLDPRRCCLFSRIYYYATGLQDGSGENSNGGRLAAANKRPRHTVVQQLCKFFTDDSSRVIPKSLRP